MSLIEFKDVTKKYKNVMALNQVSLSIGEGVCFGLLGPNGAGKTTLVRSLLALGKIDGGEITLNGQSNKNPLSRRGIAYLPEKYTFYPYYKVEDVLQFYGQMQGVSSSELEISVDKALELLELTDIRHKKIKTLSKGQIQRVGLASCLIGNNNLFIFDEPFSGLDPIWIKRLKEIIIDLKNNNKTVFLNSHILAEMGPVLTDIAIMDKGQIKVTGKTSELLAGNKNLDDYFYTVIKGGNL